MYQEFRKFDLDKRNYIENIQPVKSKALIRSDILVKRHKTARVDQRYDFNLSAVKGAWSGFEINIFKFCFFVLNAHENSYVNKIELSPLFPSDSQGRRS